MGLLLVVGREGGSMEGVWDLALGIDLAGLGARHAGGFVGHAIDA